GKDFGDSRRVGGLFRLIGPDLLLEAKADLLFQKEMKKISAHEYLIAHARADFVLQIDFSNFIVASPGEIVRVPPLAQIIIRLGIPVHFIRGENTFRFAVGKTVIERFTKTS